MPGGAQTEDWSCVWVFYGDGRVSCRLTDAVFQEPGHRWLRLLDLPGLKSYKWDLANGPADHGVQYVIWVKNP